MDRANKEEPVKIGYKLFAEEAGFDFVEISDHYHPWLFSHDHSGFAWSVLGAIAARTGRIELATGVTSRSCATTRRSSPRRRRPRPC